MGVAARASSDGNTLCICLSGYFNASICDEFRSAYEQYPNASLYRIDLSKVCEMDNAALEMLLIIRGYAPSKHAAVVLYRPTKAVAQLIESSNFNQIFDIEN
mgnify:CR=1 FL=1